MQKYLYPVIIPFGIVGAFHETSSDSVAGEILMPLTLPGISSRVTTVCAAGKVLLPAAVSGKI